MKQYTKDMFREHTQILAAYDRARHDALKQSLYSPLDLPSSLVARLSGWSQDDVISVRPRALFSFFSDHGIEDEGALTDGFQASTADTLRAVSEGSGKLSLLAEQTNTQLIPVNLGTRGIAEALPGVVHAPVMALGSNNVVNEDAMTSNAMMTAVRLGMEFATKAVSEGFKLLIATSHSPVADLSAVAVIAALSERFPEDLLERGALDNSLFQRRMEVLAKAFAARSVNRDDAFDVLEKLGGLDLAAMLGFYTGAALYGTPILLDGLTSLAAALLLTRLLPVPHELFFASHTRQDPASDIVFDELGITPVIEAPIRQSAGLGALFSLPVYDLSCALYKT